MAKSETSGELRVVAPPPILFGAGLALGAALDRLGPLPWAPRPLVVGLAPVAVGLALILWAAASFRRAGTTILPYGRATYLVPGGPYRFTRNPMYVGMTAAYLGLALLTGGAWAYVLLPAVLLVVRFGVIAREERHLEERFGEEYRAYKRRVRRWL